MDPSGRREAGVDNTAAAAPDPQGNPAEQNIGTAIIRGGVVRMFAFAYTAALGVTATAVISRAVGPNGFALYVTAISLITIATFLSDVGLAALGLREFAALKGAARVRSLRALITLRLVLAVVGSFGIVGFAVLHGYSDNLVAGLALAGVGLCLISLHVSWLVPIQATFRLNMVAALEALRQTLLMGLMIAAAVASGDIGLVVAAYLPAGLLIALATIPASSRIAPVTPSLDFAEMRSLLSHVGIYAIVATVGSTYAFFAQVVSNAELGEQESGLFALAFRVFAVLVIASFTAVGGAFPLLVVAFKEDDERRYRYALRRLVQTAFITGVGCSVALITGAAAVTALLGGSEFAGAEGGIRVIGIALPASFVVAAGGAALLAARRHAHLFVITVVGAGSSIIATALLAARYGILGASTGIVIGESVLAAGYLWGVRQVSGLAIPRARWALGVAVLGAVCCLPALFPVSGFLAAAAGLSGFTAGAFALRLVPPELVDNARGVLGRFAPASPNEPPA